MSNIESSVFSYRESIGGFLYRSASVLFLFSVALLVWRRNHYTDFGVYAPTIKPSDLLFPLALLFAFLAILLSKKLRDETKNNTLLISWMKYLSLFLALLFTGSLWSFLFLGQAPTAIDLFQYGRIVLVMGFFLLTIFFGFRNPGYLKILSLSFLFALSMAPIIFLPEDIVAGNYLITSPASYTLIAFQPGTVGSYLVFPIAIFFSLFLSGRWYKKLIYLSGTILLTALVLWTNSRAAWLSTFVAFLVATAIYIYWRKDKRAILIYGLSIFFVFLSAFFILPGLARNTVLAEIFPYPRADLHLKKDVLEKIAAARDGSSLDRIWWLSLRLPTQYYFEIREPRINFDFYASRGQIWLEHLREAFFYPMGLGPSYSTVLQDVKTDRFAGTRSFSIGAGAHNTWLQILLSAGIGGVVLSVFAIRKMAKDILVLIRSDYAVTSLWVASGFVGILVDSFFFDSLELRWFWVILGIIVVACGNYLTPSMESDASK